MAIADTDVVAGTRGRQFDHEPGSASNVVLGDVSGTVVQAGVISGGVHVHGPGPARDGTVEVRRPITPIRVRDADPRRLGVHASIQVERAVGDVPIYVARDVDVRLRALLAAADRGAFVLLVGRSSAGKTRSLYEAVRATLAESWLVVPDGPGDVAALVDVASPGMVVWLDELQKYLTGEQRLTPGVVRDLLAAGMVLVGTMWPDEYTVRTAPPVPGAQDQHRADRELLNIADVLDVADELSPAERARAQDLATRDGRLAAALASSDGGMTQVLAAGPQLVRWWQQAPTPYGRALITAAVDARRLGVTSALSLECLRQAVSGYLTPAERAAAAANWLDQALAYATTPLHGAASALSPVDAGEMGSLAGYVVADYLFQHGRSTRRTECPPASAWQAFADHHDHPADLRRLGFGAEARLQLGYATLLYRRCVDRGDKSVLLPLVDLLMRQNHPHDAAELLQTYASDARGYGKLVRLFADLNDVTALQTRADSGDWLARGWLVEVLARHGHISVLEERGRTGDLLAQGRLADLAPAPDHLADLRARAAAGDQFAAGHLAAIQTDRQHPGLADTRSAAAAPRHNDNADDLRLAGLSTEIFTTQQMCGCVDVLVAAGAVPEATDFLQACAAARIDNADDLLADLLAGTGDVDGLESVAATGEWSSNQKLADMLAASGDLDGLRAAAAEGNTFAAWKVADLLIERSEVDEAIEYLTAMADADDFLAEIRLTNILAAHDRADELEARAANSRWYTSSWIGYLVDHGRASEAIAFLQPRVDEGDNLAASQLGNLLVDLGNVDRAIALLVPSTYGREFHDGDGPAASTLLEILAKHQRVDDLRDEVDAGTAGASERWISLMLSSRAITEDEAQHLRRFGLGADGSMPTRS